MSSSLQEPRTGALLIAPPSLMDPNFRRSVVLLCEHNEEGSFGLILNRPLELHLNDVLDDVAPCEDALSLGGPVEPNTLHFLHGNPEVAGAVEIYDGIYWGGDFEAIKDLARANGAAEPLRFFLGYAGWGAEQLRTEMEDAGWILAEAEAALVFPEDPRQLWRTILRRMGGEYALLANYPDDPRLN